jgi:sorbose reductase
LAAKWARYGSSVNIFSPGFVDTVLNGGEGMVEVRKIWAERNPSGEIRVPSDLTGAVTLLSSDSGSYINGAGIVDGRAIVL